MFLFFKVWNSHFFIARFLFAVLGSYFRAIGNKLFWSLIIFLLLEHFGPVCWKILTHDQHFSRECRLSFCTGHKKCQQFTVCTISFYTLLCTTGVWLCYHWWWQKNLTLISVGEKIKLKVIHLTCCRSQEKQLSGSVWRHNTNIFIFLLKSNNLWLECQKELRFSWETGL